MPGNFEDTMAATDISGAQQPGVKSPQNIAGDAQKRVNQQKRGPDPQQQGGQKKPQHQNPLSQLADAAGGAAQGAEDFVRGQGFAQPKQNDLNPVDWLKEDAQDASVVWGYGRQAYKALSDSYHDGVANLYSGQDARSRFMQITATSLIESILPIVGLKEQAQEQVSGLGYLTGRQSEEQYKREVRSEQQQATQDAPGALADTAMMALPGGIEGKAAMIAMPLLQSLLSNDPDERDHAIFWAAGMSILSYAHLPAGVRKALLSRFQNWGAVEKALQTAVNAKRSFDRNSSDPAKRAQYLKNAIEEQLRRGSMPEAFTKTIARARGATEEVPIRAYKDPKTGAIRTAEAEKQKELQAGLHRIGVEDVDELTHKAMTEGISDPKAIDWIVKHWADLGMNHDLKRYHPEEMPLRDPVRHIRNNSIQDKTAAFKHEAAIRDWLDQIHRGLFANHHDSFTTVLRSLAGHGGATRSVHQFYVASIVKLLGKEALTEERQNLMGQAAEGDEAVYNSLRPEEQMVIDGWGLIRAAEREERASTGIQNVVPNWMPRTEKDVETMMRGPGRPSRASVLAREATLHREESIQAGPSGQLVLGQRFKTVAETNRAMAAARSDLVAQLTNPEKPLSAELQNDIAARKIHQLSFTNPVEAQRQAAVLAAQKYGDKETNFLLNINRTLANQVRSTHTLQALNEFTQMVAHDNRAAAIKLIPGATRQAQEFERQGYKRIEDARFHGYMFHPELADNLNRYVNHVSKGLRDKKGWDVALKMEGLAVAGIMFSPLVHGLNMSTRFGMAAFMNPMEMAHYIAEGKAIAPHQWDDVTRAKRLEARNAGVGVHYHNTSHTDNLLNSMQDAVGDIEERLPNETRKNTAMNRLGQAIGSVDRPRKAINNYFWGWVNDFGVAMYHVELAAARKNVLFTGTEQQAMEYAARRANSWMGLVRPEDTNPFMHDLSRLVMFAPNWWRTWGELMVPWYRRAGFRQDPSYMRYAAYQGAKTMMAAFAVQKMSGNAWNYALSGHLQSENHPGNQDRLEITRPEILQHLQDVGVLPKSPTNPDGTINKNYIDPNTGVNPYTGARYTMENPWGRQMLQTEQALGYQSGQSGTRIGPQVKVGPVDIQPSLPGSAEDTSDGMTRFVGARLSPLATSLFGALNVDLYQSVHDGEFRAVNPEQRAFSLSPTNVLYGLLMMLPNGQQFSQQVNQNAAQGQPNAVESAMGTRLPHSLQDVVGDVKGPVERTLFQWFTGINPPYESSQRTRGQKSSDQDYQRLKELTDSYDSQQRALSAEALSGQSTPAKWLKEYQSQSQKHSAAMDALFKGSPQYATGAEGMASEWEGLYQQATLQDGSLDYQQLDQLQNKFRHDPNHSPEQLRQMDALLAQNEHKYPMLALYHQTERAFRDWQEKWAADNGVDINQLRTTASQYGQLFGDTRQQQQFLTQNPQLARYETAKQRQWETTVQGLLWLSFYGNNAKVNQYLRAHQETLSDLETAAGGGS